MNPWTLTSHSPEETRDFGESIGALLKSGMVLALAGDLGSGKTCLAQGVARGLGVSHDYPITSPTYTLMNHYQGRYDIYHFDFYRLDSKDELEELGFDDYISKQGVVIYEWSQRFDPFDLDALHFSLKWLGDEKREIVVSASGPTAVGLLETVQNEWAKAEDS